MGNTVLLPALIQLAPRCDFESGGGPKFPNGGACPMVLLGGILF